MNLRKLFLSTLLLISTAIVFSCSIKRTKYIAPVFTLTLDSISRDINSIIVTPEATITGKEIITDGNTTTELTINLINSKRLPEAINEQKKIAEDIAILIRNTLKDPNSFTEYKVLFTKRTVDGAWTKSKYVGYSYNAKNLKNYIQIVSVGDHIDSLTTDAIGKMIFSLNEPNIVSAFSYYNNVPGSPIKYNLYKETDSGMVLLISRDQGKILVGNNYLINKLTTAEFYKIKGFGSGKYEIEYLVSDTAAGSMSFILE